MIIKNINIPLEIQISLVNVKDDKFLCFSNELNTRYFCISTFLNIYIKENVLMLNDIKNDVETFEFIQFVEFLNFELKNLAKKYSRYLTLKGLGFRMYLNKELKIAEFKLGFSHYVSLKIPEKIRIRQQKKFIKVESKDKILLGQFINKVISLKMPDSYKGKGFWYKYQKKKLKAVKKK